MGLSRGQVALAVLLTLFWLALLFAFLLLSLSCFLQEDAFASISQSVLVGTVGRGIFAVRRRAQTNNAELQKAVDIMIGEKQEAADEE